MSCCPESPQSNVLHFDAGSFACWRSCRVVFLLLAPMFSIMMHMPASPKGEVLSLALPKACQQVAIGIGLCRLHVLVFAADS